MSDTSPTDDGNDVRLIYLSGPIDNCEDPNTWREEVQERFPHLEFVDPQYRFPDYQDDPANVVDWDLERARKCNLLVCNIGDEAPETVGTHHEIAAAIEAGRTVAVVPDGELSPFVEDRDTVVCDSVLRALAVLTPDSVLPMYCEDCGGMVSEEGSSETNGAVDRQAEIDADALVEELEGGGNP